MDGVALRIFDSFGIGDVIFADGEAAPLTDDLKPLLVPIVVIEYINWVATVLISVLP